MAAEIVAGISAVAVQASQGASVERQIAVAVGVIAILGSVWAVAKFLVGPIVRGWMWATIANDPGKLTETIIEAFDRNPNTRAITRQFIDRLYAEKIANDQETKDIAEANRDRLVFLEESVKRQGEALTKDMATAMRDFTRSNEAQTTLMREMQQELKKLSDAYIRLDATVANWDGHERRSKPR